jgi:hypothetical protein
MAMKISSKTILIAFGFFFSFYDGMAQCAMCRMTIENNVSNGDTTIGAGLNLGILYLFVTPYVLLTVLAVLWYRHSKKKKKISSWN